MYSMNLRSSVNSFHTENSGIALLSKSAYCDATGVINQMANLIPISTSSTLNTMLGLIVA